MTEEKTVGKVRQGCGVGCLSLLFVMGMFACLAGVLEDEPSPTPKQRIAATPTPVPTETPEAVPDLDARVRLHDGLLHVTNNDSLPWRNVRVKLNPGFFANGYYSDWNVLPAGETVSAPLRMFANGDGERFNSLAHKLRKVEIVAYRDGERCLWLGSYGN